jgi:hypothetical protein
MNGMTTLVTNSGIRFKFDPDGACEWDLYDAQTNKKIGYFEVDDEWIVVGARIIPEYQRRGVATSFFRWLSKECKLEVFFWPPDGNTYDDGRHLSEEGACLAGSLVSNGLAQWYKVGPCEENSDF